MTIKAKYPGTCNECGHPFAAGASIEWQRGLRPCHTTCGAPDATPTAAPGAAAKPYRPTRRSCTQCGARPDARGWPRIYRSGVCSDCYRDDHDEAAMGF